LRSVTVAFLGWARSKGPFFQKAKRSGEYLEEEGYRYDIQCFLAGKRRSPECLF